MHACVAAPHTAFLQTVALSNVAGFAGALANLAFNMPKQNPVTPGPIIDYDLLLLVRRTATTHPANTATGSAAPAIRPLKRRLQLAAHTHAVRMQCVTTQAAGQAVTPLLLPLPYPLAAAAKPTCCCCMSVWGTNHHGQHRWRQGGLLHPRMDHKIPDAADAHTADVAHGQEGKAALVRRGTGRSGCWHSESSHLICWHSESLNLDLNLGLSALFRVSAALGAGKRQPADGTQCVHTATSLVPMHLCCGPQGSGEQVQAASCCRHPGSSSSCGSSRRRS